MASVVAKLLVCLSLLLVSRSTINGARILEGSGGDEEYRYWKDITKDSSTPIPEALKGLLPRVQVQTKTGEGITGDCHTGKRGTTFTQEFEPRPDATAYPAASNKHEKLFVKEFEPRPDVTSYPAADKLFVKDFEPRPDATSYPAADKLFVKDFEPRPDATSYPTADKRFVKDFEPRADATSYPTADKLFVKEFEPRPDATSYPATDKLFVQDFEPRPDATSYPVAIDKDEKLQFIRYFAYQLDA